MTLSPRDPFRPVAEHECDVLVVGGGAAGVGFLPNHRDHRLMPTRRG